MRKTILSLTVAASIAAGTVTPAVAQTGDAIGSLGSSTGSVEMSATGSLENPDTALLIVGGIATTALVAGAAAAGVTWAVQQRIIANPLPGIIPGPPPLPAAPARPAAAPQPARPAAAPQPARPAPSNTSYRNCTAVWNAINRPIRRGEPGYASHLDRDGDGVGCENDPR